MATSSNALIQILRQEIEKEDGRISFAAFMERALYHPAFGYYNTPQFNLGREGDFTTAPEISPLFARCFARQYMEIFDALSTGNLLELGAGTGRFASDCLLELERHRSLPDRYFIYEISETLRLKQQALLASTCPHLLPRVVWLNELPQQFVGIIVANEVLDALPVHCFRIEGHTVKERCVAWGKDRFIWQPTAPTVTELAEKTMKIRERYELADGYESELNLNLPRFIESLTGALAQGVILLADYGYGQQEYYHPERRQGTLTCFYQHRRHDDPLILPGLQDITAHVDFTPVVETAVANECTLGGYTTQAAFLFANGLIELAEIEEKNLSPADTFHLHQAIKQLTLPTEMGDRIKVMALCKNMEHPLSGFSLLDRGRDL
ncbi:class I SAM-dependent methyltransferase [Aquicella lusitana]|uniref:SAM-dependent MidA family methyltransferase n=1 Tax=Aquicella lusitana TaxID=254246 RepID=A0A370GGJ7_9COXI|nr:SAM-dependent methyltransferase [Aquicella lusitana]RDI42450.1 SAM-dependent MidA family methyltransferase [Aquicella lusitana]VVC74088.1 hypothetical protein AQULUS_18520 [Aquicella lusitana]